MVSLADAERANADRRHYRQMWRDGEAPMQPATMHVIEPELSPQARAWKHFMIRCTVEAARVGKLNYRNGMEPFFGGNARKWRAYIDRLVRWDMCWPPSGEGTAWREGKNAALVLDLLVGGQLPPLPPGEYPPSLVDTTTGGVDNPRNTGETRVESDSTVYAHERR
jgi:hypothetical protein